MRANIETSKAVGSIGKHSDKSKYQEGNGYTNDGRLESFGFFLEEYVIQGAELTINSINPKKILVGEGIISIDSELWRSFATEFNVSRANTTYYVGFQSKIGYIVGETEPLNNYLRLWEVKTDATGKIGTPIDHRGQLNRIKYKADYDGVFFNNAEVNEAIASLRQAMSTITDATNKSVASTTAAKTATTETLQVKIDTLAVKTLTEKALIDMDNAKKSAIEETQKIVALKGVVEEVVSNARTVTQETSEIKEQTQSIIDNFGPVTPFLITAHYKKTNLVSDGNGSTYIAIENTTNKPLTDTTVFRLFAGKGDKGDTGPKGDTGSQGLKGEKGDKGATGDRGIQGLKGDTGEIGPQGIQGLRGETGPQGIQGVKGDKGDKGDSFTVNRTGLLSGRSAFDSQPAGYSYLATDDGKLYIRQGVSGWSNGISFGKGDKGDKGDAGATGPQGLQGLRGDTGDTGPQGPQGIQGIQGIKGDTGEQGIPGEKGDTGTPGLKGDKGDQGIAGANGKTWHSGTTAPANTLGVIGDYHLNTSTWAILEKTAATTWTSRGNIKGAQGIQGIQGVTGPPGTTSWNGITDIPADRTRKITISTSNPTGGSNGDIWFKYE